MIPDIDQLVYIKKKVFYIHASALAVLECRKKKNILMETYNKPVYGTDSLLPYIFFSYYQMEILMFRYLIDI